VRMPPVFTDDEISRFRAELASKRQPGAYEPGRWSVSPLNRDIAVAGADAGKHPAARRDAALGRDAARVVATAEAKASYLRQLVRSEWRKSSRRESAVAMTMPCG